MYCWFQYNLTFHYFQQFQNFNEETEDSEPEVSSEYELSSRSKRKMSRDPGIFDGATRAVTEMLAGVSGVDIFSDTEDDFSNDITMKASFLVRFYQLKLNSTVYRV